MDCKKLLQLLFASVLVICGVEAKAERVYFKSIRDAAKKISYGSDADYALGAKLMEEIRSLAKTRKQVFPKPIFMAESLSAAGRMWFTLHNYSDRQLFAARDMWDSDRSQFKTISHRKTFELMHLSGFDACTSFLYGERGGRYLETFPAVKPQITFIPNLVPQGYEGKLEPAALKKAAQSPHTLKINGKMVIASYSSLDIPQTAEFIRTVEKMAGIPISLLYNHGTLRGQPDPFDSYMLGKGVSAILILKWFDFLSGILEHADGIEYSNRLTEPDGTLCVKYYDEYVMPLFAAVCAQEKYNGKKYFCQQISWGYNNFTTKQRLSHNGTKTVRSFLKLLRKHKVDFVKAFEWDEYNEDTHFQPTVNKPMALARIMRYYSNVLLKGEKVSPLPGDDISLPNLIVSQMKQIIAGPDFELEILHIPDSVTHKKFNVTAEVIDETGKLIKRSRKLNFDRAELKEFTLKVPTAGFIDSHVLITRLIIEEQGQKRVIQEGLPFTKVSTTAAIQKTWYATPLRNVLFPVKSRTIFGKAASTTLPERITLPVSSALEFKETLNSVEVVQNGRDNRFSYDPNNEYLQNDPDRINLLFTAFRLEKGAHPRFKGKISFRNAPSAVWFAPPIDPNNRYITLPNVKVNVHKVSEKPDITIKMLCSWQFSRMFSIKRSEFAKAVFSIKGEIIRGPNKGMKLEWEVPLAKLLKSGLQNHIFPNDAQFALDIPQRMNYLPLPLNCRSVKFDTVINTGYPEGVFGIRAVSRSGKVYWSAPHVVKAPLSGKKQKIAVYHDVKGAYECQIDSSRLLHINYRFDPELAGKILTASSGRQFYANAGGYPSVGTGYEGLMCALFSAPHSFGRFRKADDSQPCTPTWVKEKDGKWVLDFSGKGEFIIFPASVFPQRSGYTVKMKYFPRQVWKDQVYFTHEEVSSINGFRVRTEDERLVVDFYRRQADGAPRESSKVFKTNLTPEDSRWNQLTFSWDIKSFKITLNGKSESFPCSGIARFIAIGGFGGAGTRSRNGAVQYFNGKLASFEVIHAPGK